MSLAFVLRAFTFAAFLTILQREARSQVPSSVAIITQVVVSNGIPSTTYRNESQKDITALAFKKTTDPYKGDLVVVNYPDEPPAPGETRTLTGGWTLKDAIDPALGVSQLSLAAVIFSDGTHVGGAPDRAALGQDVVAEIFASRAAAAAEWKKWSDYISRLPADDKSAVDQFVKDASALTIPQHVSGGHQAIAVAHVQANIKQQAAFVSSALSKGTHDARWVRITILKADQQKSASMQTQSVDAGEGIIQ